MTESDVAKMRIDLELLQGRLNELVKDNAIIIEQIEIKQKDVDAKRVVCEQEEEETAAAKRQAEQLSKECQQELGRVLPILASSAESLKQIKKDDLTKMKSYSNPSESIRVVMEGMCLALGVDKNVKSKPIYPGSFDKYQDFWEYSKKYLLNDKLQKIIKKYDQEQIIQLDPANIQKLKVLIENPLFDKEKIQQASQAAYNLSMWIRAIYDVYEAMVIVGPKKKELEVAQESLEKAKILLDEKKKYLAELLEELAKYQADFQKASQEKEEILAKVINVKKQLERAEKLMTGLAGEKLTWIEKGKICRNNSVNLIGDALLCASIVAYHGIFPLQYREESLNFMQQILKELQIESNQNFKLQNRLCEAIDIDRWVSKFKLPNDPYSIENTIIMKNSKQWPICIDPQNQANQFIREMESENNLKVIQPRMPINQIQSVLENSLQLGYPILIEGFGQYIDPPMLQPIITQKFIPSGISQFKVKLGDHWITSSIDFTVYITSHLNNPVFSSRLSGKTVILDFTVTVEGLQDNLINTVVLIEEPQKEAQRLKNVSKLFENKLSVDKTEKHILQLINSSKGDDLLNDEQLVLALESSKKETDEMKEKMDKLEQDQNVLNQTRNFNLKVAQHVALIFFVFIDLQKVEPMYQFSLEWFIDIFCTSMSKSSQQQNERGKKEKRQWIIENFMKDLYNITAMSIKSEHLVLFTFLMCEKILIKENILTLQEIRLFCEQANEDIKDFGFENPNPVWINSKMWKGMVQIFTALPSIFTQEMMAQFQSENHIFKELFSKNDAEIFISDLLLIQKLPEKWQQLTQFQRLILLKVLKPNKIIGGMKQLVQKELGSYFITQPITDYNNIFEESIPQKPLLFIQSSGTDPYQIIAAEVEKRQLFNKFHALSLGQGQLEKAQSKVFDCIKSGEWVLLQNCHLAPSFLPNLQKIFDYLQSLQTVNKNFKLILTTKSCSNFPLQIIQRSIKIRTEQPTGIKNFLTQAYQLVETDYTFQTMNSNDQRWQKLFFSLSFFHGVINERKKYGPLGWNKPYEFTIADLSISLQQISQFLLSNQSNELIFPAMLCIIGKSNYGGRITDHQDLILLQVILKKFINPQIFQNDFKMSESNQYPIPDQAQGKFWKIHQEVIQQYPEFDKADIFGMDKNAEISAQIRAGDEIQNILLSLLPKSSSNQSQQTNSQNNPVQVYSTEQLIKEKCQQFLQELPPYFQESQVIQDFPIKYEESLNTILIMEIKRYNKLSQIIKQSLENVINAIDGVNTMSKETEILFDNIYDNKVPYLWEKYAYESRKPLGSWMKDLKERLSFFNKWIQSKKTPYTFWVGGFFFTTSFFTGILQNCARVQQCPIISLRFTFEVIPYWKMQSMKIGEQYPEKGCYIQGLYLDGAKWNNLFNCLQEPIPNQLYDEMPYIWCKPIDYKWLKIKQRLINTYSCPLYRTSKRQGNISSTGISTNHLMNIDLPYRKNDTRDYWILRGVAMITQRDD